MAKKPSKRCVVDTNVPKIANRSIDIANMPLNEILCIQACVDACEAIIERKRELVLDKLHEIFEEYKKQLCLSGQPGVGDAFGRWVKDYQWEYCIHVRITKTDDGYEEFPKSDALRTFDPSDKKFVAVANATKVKTPIIVAEDRGWHNHKDALEAAGITVEFLFPRR